VATLNREAIEQEIGKRFEKIEKTLERTLEKTLEKAIGKAAEIANSPAATRAQAAAEAAKKSIDDVLLGLEHKGYNVKAPQDLIHTVGRRVLERASGIAEDVRSQVAAQPYSPEWLKTATSAAATEVQKRSAAMKSADLAVETTVAAPSAEPDVAATSVAEASKSDQAADFAPAEKTAKKSSKASKTKK
jgi:hypothetical protein